MSTRVCVVTGASDGIGREIARGLAAQGDRVILACRDAVRGAAARDDIAATTGNAALEVRLVDLSLQSSIRAFAAEVLAAHPRLDVLVNNAATWSVRRRTTPEGVELTWATNVLGYFLITGLLLPRLRALPAARIVNVASDLARGLDLSDPELERRRYKGVAAYARSKQANRMLTWALARRLEGSSVTANAVHPGGVKTGLFLKGGGLMGWLGHIAIRLAGRTPAQGADTPLWLATSAEVEGVSGLYFTDRRDARCPFRNEAQEERLWRMCEERTGYALSAR